jgi:hypothetical protein
MPEINKQELRLLYKAEEINEVWQLCQGEKVIEHPQYGWISPHHYRTMYHNKPCPYCGQKMVHGQSIYSCQSRSEAMANNWEYLTQQGRKILNQAGGVYYHPNYVTLDHKLNKARFPDRMFDHDNLQIICWKCNHLKRDKNTFDVDHNQSYLDSLVEDTLNKYPLL